MSMKTEEKQTKGLGGAAFLPILLFVAMYIGAGLFFESQGVEFAFYQFPSIAIMFIVLIVAFAMTKGTLNERFSVFTRGIANEGVITMLIIYMLAGGFSGMATAMGGRDAVVNLGLSFVPVQFLAVGVFIISAFMGTATGTSVGTISAVAPIAIGLADKGGLNVALVIGACVGGAMFGDNLSMISDTTIAATQTQGVEMKDKFRVNFMIALPAAICTIIALLIFGAGAEPAAMDELTYSLPKIIPYLAVFVLAIAGVNVFLVLSGGVVIAALVGILTGSFTLTGAAQSFWSGVTSMDEIFYLTMLMAGVVELVRHNGGVTWIMSKMEKMIKSEKSAQLVLAVLAMLLDIATATNTVAILVEGSMAKDISKEYKIDPRRTASILDIFSCVMQGALPYSGQVLVSVSFAAAAGLQISAFDFIPYIWYCGFLGIFAVISIFVPFSDGIIRKHPWNWETDKAE